MRKLLLVICSLFATSALADPDWFDRPQASMVANQMASQYRHFYDDLTYELGRNDPLVRVVYNASFDMDEIARNLYSNYPFDPLYQQELRYYNVTWQNVQREWYYARIRDPYIQREHDELDYNTTRLHRIFNAVPPERWLGSCRVVLETIWGQDLQDHWGRSTAGSQAAAIQLARQDGVQQCEFARGNDSLKRCTVDNGQCTAVRGMGDAAP